MSEPRAAHWVRALYAFRLAALASLLLLSFACAGTSDPSLEHDPLTRQQELLAALAHYSDLILKMDAAGLAASFVDDGETVDGDQPPLRGPEAIRARLESFKGYHVLENKLSARETHVTGKEARMTGTFWQRVRIPDGSVVIAQGTFTADWVEVSKAIWKLRRMATVAQAPTAP